MVAPAHAIRSLRVCGPRSIPHGPTTEERTFTDPQGGPTSGFKANMKAGSRRLEPACRSSRWETDRRRRTVAKGPFRKRGRQDAGPRSRGKSGGAFRRSPARNYRERFAMRSFTGTLDQCRPAFEAGLSGSRRPPGPGLPRAQLYYFDGSHADEWVNGRIQEEICWSGDTHETRRSRTTRCT